MIETLKNRRLLLFGCIACSIGYIFSISLSSLGLLIFLSAYLVDFKRILKARKIFLYNSFSLLIWFMILLLLGILYTPDKHKALSIVMRFLPFFILSLIFGTIIPFTSNEKYLIKRVYIYTLCFFFIACLTFASYRQYILYLRVDKFNWYYFYRFDFLEIFDQHPTYISMFSNLALSFIFFNSRILNIQRIWLSMLSAVLIAGILLSGSRMGYILLILISIIHFFNYLKFTGRRYRVRTIIIFGFLFMALTMIAWNIPIIKERILYTIGSNYNYKYNNSEFIKEKSEEEQGRLLLWADAWDLIKEKPLLGYGTGSQDYILTKKYIKEKHDMFLEKGYNVHNTYLTLILTGGLPLLFIYLYMLTLILKTGIKKRDLITISFFLIISLTSITESIFRAQGIVFFAFFYCFLLSNNND